MSLKNEYNLSKVKSIVDVIKNTLILTDETLQKVDFDQFILIQLPIKHDDTQVQFKFDTKASLNVPYKLESNQTFSLNRLDASAVLELAGLTKREFDKSEYESIRQQLSDYGVLTVTSGSINDEEGDANCVFSITELGDKKIKANFIDCAKNEKLANLFDILFSGSVDLTFKGKEIENKIPFDPNNPPTRPNDPMEPRLETDISPFFKNRNLGNINLANSTVHS